jgi:hypothetical protein
MTSRMIMLLLLVVGVLVASAPAQSRQPARTLRGEIVFVDIEEKTIRVAVTQRQETVEHLVSTDENTQYVLDGEAVTLVDLRRWMRVTISPESGTASRVTARSLTPAELRARRAASASRGGN